MCIYQNNIKVPAMSSLCVSDLKVHWQQDQCFSYSQTLTSKTLKPLHYILPSEWWADQNPTRTGVMCFLWDVSAQNWRQRTSMALSLSKISIKITPTPFPLPCFCVRHMHLQNNKTQARGGQEEANSTLAVLVLRERPSTLQPLALKSTSRQSLA
jgi:hypothetical protein